MNGSQRDDPPKKEDFQAILEFLLWPEGVQQAESIARESLDTLKRQKLVLDWRKKLQARADVRLSIEKILEGLPKAYAPDLYQQKCDAVYQHIFDSYFGPGQSIYGQAA
jgi:type I restriction enzyme R subunit